MLPPYKQSSLKYFSKWISIIMQLCILFAVFAASQAAVLVAPAVIGTGASKQYRSQDNLGNYAFGYNERHATGGSFRKETGSHGVVAGSYGLAVADGRQRIVNYVADAAGFRADIKTNEPGVEPKDPANVAINKAPVVVAPAIHYAAPAIHYAAPAAIVKVGHPLGGYAYSTGIGHGHVATHFW